MDNEVYELFIEDTKEKSLIARSSKSLRSRTKGKFINKTNNKMNGVITVSSIYDTIMSYSEFQKLSKTEKLKTLYGYQNNGKTRQEIADTWGKKVQAIHDLIYRLSKQTPPPQTNKKSKVTKLKDVKSEISEEILPEVAQEISPCYIKMVRHMDGDEVKEWTLKIIDLIVGTKISVLFDIKKQSKADPSKFAFSVQLVDEYTTEELLEEVTNIAGMLRKDKYQVSFELKEL